MKNKKENFSLPCLRGSIGKWNYYNVVMPFKDVARIDNNHIIKESHLLDNWLQRKLSDRTGNIKEYLLKEDERFFNSIIVGVYGDMPDWYSLNLNKIAEENNLNLGDQIQNSLGILELTGNEILFTIDGQHRIEGIKLALEQNYERFANDEISVMFIAHNNDEKGKIRTRKLFATINREAVRPTKNDLAIIDEVYAYNLIARDLYSRFDKFRNLIALTETPNLDRNNHKDFTNLLTLVEINKIVLKSVKYKQSKFNAPDLELRQELFKTLTNYWDFIIEKIKLYDDFFKNKITIEEVRNSDKSKAISLLFVPIGQKFIADLYLEFYKSNQLHLFVDKINLIDFDLKNGHFKNLFYNPVKNLMLMTNYRVSKKYAMYLMGLELNTVDLKKELCKAYGINELSNEFVNFKLSKPL